MKAPTCCAPSAGRTMAWPRGWKAYGAMTANWRSRPPGRCSCSMKISRTLCWFFAILLQGAVAWASTTPQAWIEEAQRIRMIAENDVPEAAVQVEKLGKSLPSDAPASLRVRLLNLRARIANYGAQTELARSYIDEALALAEQADDQRGQAESHLNAVLITTNQGQLEAAARSSMRALALLKGLDEPVLLCEALLRNAVMYRRNGQIDSAIALTVKAREMAAQITDPLALTYVYQGLGVTYENTEKPEEGSAYFLQMRDMARAAGTKQLEAFAFQGYAHAEFKRGHREIALNAMKEAARLFEATGAPFNIGHNRYGLAFMLRQMGQHAETVKLMDDIVSIYRSHPNPLGLWWSLQGRAADLQALGRRTEAEVDTREAYKLSQQINFPLYRAESAKSMASLAASHSEYQRAYEYLLESLNMTARSEQQRIGEQTVQLAERYLSESKQKQIEELTQREQQRALHQRWLWTVLLATVALLILATLFLLQQRKLNRKLSQLYTQLQQSRSQLQATFDAIPDALFVLDGEGRCLESHAAPADPFPQDMLQRWQHDSMREALPIEAAAVCNEALSEAARHGASAGQQFKLDLPTGRLWFELSVARKREVPGQLGRFIVLARDITERKRMESALAEREREFRTLAENAPDIIVRYDASAHPVFVNRAYVEASAQSVLPEILDMRADAAALARADVQDREYVQRLQEALTSGLAAEIRLSRRVGPDKTWYHSFRVVAERAADGRVVGALAIGRDITALIEAEQKLRESSAQLRELAARRDTAREEERKRIARELHDELGQTLTAFRLDIATLQLQFGPDNAALEQRCQHLLHVADRTIHVVRTVASTLRPAVLDMGTVPALEWLAAEFRARTGVECRLEVSALTAALNETQSVAIFRIVQESLTNVTRHANAHTVSISLLAREDHYRLRISDDGAGFRTRQTARMSFGLVGIRERALMINGEARVESSPGHGTTVEVDIPFQQQFESTP
ncbi:MAG TPA: PAS domain-containing protein [Burkholderiaceae bacterium]|nr:PAS domain-containing protein [Burkholderiaceae bacterium]